MRKSNKYGSNGELTFYPYKVSYILIHEKSFSGSRKLLGSRFRNSGLYAHTCTTRIIQAHPIEKKENMKKIFSWKGKNQRESSWASWSWQPALHLVILAWRCLVLPLSRDFKFFNLNEKNIRKVLACALTWPYLFSRVEAIGEASLHTLRASDKPLKWRERLPRSYQDDDILVSLMHLPSSLQSPHTFHFLINLNLDVK